VGESRGLIFLSSKMMGNIDVAVVFGVAGHVELH
jgi:hypothetical protein